MCRAAIIYWCMWDHLFNRSTTQSPARHCIHIFFAHFSPLPTNQARRWSHTLSCRSRPGLCNLHVTSGRHWIAYTPCQLYNSSDEWIIRRLGHPNQIRMTSKTLTDQFSLSLSVVSELSFVGIGVCQILVVYYCKFQIRCQWSQGDMSHWSTGQQCNGECTLYTLRVWSGCGNAVDKEIPDKEMETETEIEIETEIVCLA